jgi:hypothetical protein
MNIYCSKIRIEWRWSIDLPVADIHVTNDRLVHITVTGIHHLQVTFSAGLPVTSSTYLGHSIVLYIN